MKHVYANLLGKWENLNDDPNSLIFESSPNIYVEDEILLKILKNGSFDRTNGKNR